MVEARQQARVNAAFNATYGAKPAVVGPQIANAVYGVFGQ